MEWLVAAGAFVLVPLLSSPDYDLIADFDGGLVRVQVKTSSFFVKQRWSVAVCTRGGNQSWNRIVKRFDPSRCDYLFAHVGDGRRWFVPAGELDGGTQIVLGGPKYSEFEIEPGHPLQSRSAAVAQPFRR
jgi:hypothetical protein